MRQPVIAGNWKLYNTSEKALAMINDLIPLVKDAQRIEIIIAPVFTVLCLAQKAIRGTNIKLAGQDCFWEEEGAFTGEISSTMLTDVGCSHVIIGHSERRQYFAETDGTVNKKSKAAVNAGLTVLLCIGETLQEREKDQTFAVLKRQLHEGLKDLSSADLDKIIIAYEPVWAIGTGKTATDAQAQEAHQFIRGVVKELYGDNTAEKIRILYGGSVKPENIKGLMAQKDIDGALVGGASLKADSFSGIINYAK